MFPVRFRTPAPLAASLAAILAAGIAGCGSSTHHSTTQKPQVATHIATTPPTTPTTTPTPTASASGSTGDTGAVAIPADDVAVVDGTPITGATFEHWLTVTTYSNAAGRGGTPVVPDPPKFTHCIAEARAIVKLKDESTQRLKNDCEALLASDTGQTMDFLIKNVWLEKAAAADGLSPSAAVVKHQFLAEKAKEFKRPAAFKTFLAKTKQTIPDILLRIRINDVLDVLAKRAQGAKALETELEFTYKPLTHCIAGYAISDCAGTPDSSSG